MSHFGRSGPPDISDTYSLPVLNITFRTLKKGSDSGFNDMEICSSLNKTAAFMSSMLMAANSVRAAACEGECGYVSSEREKKMTISNGILEADAACKEKLEQIHKKWQDLILCKAPQELAQHISEQCKACDALIESKKSFAELIRGELKAVDEDYHRMFRQQAKDVDMLVISMGTQVLEELALLKKWLRKAYH